MILRKPCSGRADEVCEFSGQTVEDGSRDGDAVHPQVPGSEEPTQIPESPVGPDVESAFQRPNPVETDDGGGHRYVKDQHGCDPGESLRPAQSRRNSDPGTADDAKDLGQNQIAQSQAALKLMLAVRRIELINVLNGCTPETKSSLRVLGYA
jgi:hypothetical protein